MPDGPQQFNPNAPYQKPQAAFDPKAPYQKPDATAAPNSAPVSTWQKVKNWWDTPTPLRIPSGYGGWKELPGTDVSPKEHIGQAVKDASIVGAAGAPLGEIAAGRSLIPVAKAVGRSLIGAGIGSAGGSWLGGYAGEALKNRQLGEEIGGAVGGLTGGVYGGLDRPVLGPWGSRYSVGRMIPSLAREPELAGQEKLGAFMNKGYKPAAPPASTAMAPFKRGVLAEVDRPAMVAANPRGPYLTPAQELAARQAGDSGGVATRRIGAPEEPGVTLFPEPQARFEGETPNYMASVPRDELPEMAQRGKLGAGKQLQQLGAPILYTPRASIGGSGYEDFRNGLIGAQAGLPPELGPVKEGGGIAARGLMTEPPRTIPEQVAQSNARLIQTMKDVLRNPKASAEEIAGAKQRLSEMGAQ